MLDKNPPTWMRHLSDEELVRSADGELSSERSAEVDAHLEACWDCRTRMEDMQSAITSFVRAHRAEFDAQLTPATGPRALLRARLTQLDSELRSEWWKRVFRFGFGLPRVAMVCLPLIAVAIGTVWFRSAANRELRASSAWLDAETTPNRNLTPGATRPVTISEVCSVAQEEVIADVSVSLREKVFQEYGIANTRPQDYEIDYLIAPRLGGIEDIRNLWPEPYRTREWNAHVKDALEERLHEMVCSGQLDLYRAQHDIATDWIAAYKKYFRTNKPLPVEAESGYKS
jgi:hypothetical protein